MTKAIETKTLEVGAIYSIESEATGNVVALWTGSEFLLFGESRENGLHPDNVTVFTKLLSPRQINASRTPLRLEDLGRQGMFASQESLQGLMDAASRYRGEEGTIAVTYAMMGYNTALDMMYMLDLIKPYAPEENHG
ncbi:hypothetical protein VH22019_00064 [Vibrio phage VH2_2019]|nr:hypothetical protein VH22019_00064 [Vibrio phage VH2_2019]